MKLLEGRLINVSNRLPVEIKFRAGRPRLNPSAGGRFEVTLDGELLFSKAALKRHAEPGEIHALVERLLGPPIDRESFH